MVIDFRADERCNWDIPRHPDNLSVNSFRFQKPFLMRKEKKEKPGAGAIGDSDLISCVNRTLENEGTQQDYNRSRGLRLTM